MRQIIHGKSFICLKLLLFCVSGLRPTLREVSWLATFLYFRQYFVASYHCVLRCSTDIKPSANVPVPDRGKVVGGLPDVVTIMEKKVCVWRSRDCGSAWDLIMHALTAGGLFLSLLQTLSLTCTVCGDPKPQVSWLKGGNEVEPDDQVESCRKSRRENTRVDSLVQPIRATWPALKPALLSTHGREKTTNYAVSGMNCRVKYKYCHAHCNYVYKVKHIGASILTPATH